MRGVHGRRNLVIGVAVLATAVAATIGSMAAARARETTPPPAKPTLAATPAATASPATTASPTPAPAATASPAPTTAPTAKPAIATAAATAAPAPADCIPTTADGLAGHIDQLSVGGHSVYVDVPGAYAALPTQRFPVVYFLHGSTGSGADWLGSGSSLPTILNGLTATNVLMPMIAVYPDGDAVTPDGNYWGDDTVGDRDESWLINQLIPAIDGRYRTLGARYRGIAGLSSGGFGALNISIHHPGIFSWVASYSGVFTAPQSLFGAGATANSPQLTVAGVPASERVPLFLGGGANDTEYLPDTLRFIATVQALGWEPLHTQIVPGPHGWQAWQVEAQDSLDWLGQLWGRAC
jgi:enterochelin esterase-like enzyme